MKIETTLTDAAKKQLDLVAERRLYMRISAERVGCCGCTLVFYEDQKKPEDKILEIDGYPFLAGQNEAEILRGVAVIDYGRKGLLNDFKIKFR